jgi:dTDP-4-dehydrorhamnose reductase
VRVTQETRIFVAGCGGMLGDAVWRHLSPIARVQATDIAVDEPWLGYADVRDHRSVAAAVERFKPDVIINLAALTDLEYCERHPEEAWLTNALGAENLALIAGELDVPHVYISTAGIFDGRKESYTDFDEPRPSGAYAQSKYYGEVFVRQHLRKHYVLRAGWMMGGGPRKDKKFLAKIYRQLIAGATVLHVVDDKFGVPTYTVDFAAGMQKVLESGLYGLYNHACEGSGSRYDVALEFVKLLGLEREVEVRRVGSDFFATEFFAPRPESERLLNVKLKARGLDVMRDWRECLAEYSACFRADLAEHRATAARDRQRAER